MTVPTTNRVTAVPGYELSPPTGADARAMVHRVFGAERGEAVWVEACRHAGLAPDGVHDVARLQGVIIALAAQGKAASTIARSLDIRLRTYARLAARLGASEGASA